MYVMRVGLNGICRPIWITEIEAKSIEHVKSSAHIAI